MSKGKSKVDSTKFNEVKKDLDEDIIHRIKCSEKVKIVNDDLKITSRKDTKADNCVIIKKLKQELQSAIKVSDIKKVTNELLELLISRN